MSSTADPYSLLPQLRHPTPPNYIVRATTLRCANRPSTVTHLPSAVSATAVLNHRATQPSSLTLREGDAPNTPLYFVPQYQALRSNHGGLTPSYPNRLPTPIHGLPPAPLERSRTGSSQSIPQSHGCQTVGRPTLTSGDSPNLGRTRSPPCLLFYREHLPHRRRYSPHRLNGPTPSIAIQPLLHFPS